MAKQHITGKEKKLINLFISTARDYEVNNKKRYLDIPLSPTDGNLSDNARHRLFKLVKAHGLNYRYMATTARNVRYRRIIVGPYV